MCLFFHVLSMLSSECVCFSMFYSCFSSECVCFAMFYPCFHLNCVCFFSSECVSFALMLRVATVREKVLENEKFSRSGKSQGITFSVREI